MRSASTSIMFTMRMTGASSADWIDWSRLSSASEPFASSSSVSGECMTFSIASAGFWLLRCCSARARASATSFSRATSGRTSSLTVRATFSGAIMSNGSPNATTSASPHFCSGRALLRFQKSGVARSTSASGVAKFFGSCRGSCPTYSASARRSLPGSTLPLSIR